MGGLQSAVPGLVPAHSPTTSRCAAHSLAVAPYIWRMPPLTGIGHLSLSVRNLRRSELWYRELFGFERVSLEHATRFDSVVLRDPQSTLTVSLHEHRGAGTA